MTQNNSALILQLERDLQELAENQSKWKSQPIEDLRKLLAAFEKLKKIVADLIQSQPPLDAEDMKAAETIYAEVVDTCRHLLRLCLHRNGKLGAFDLLN